MTKTLTPALKVTKGRIKLLFDQPFFGGLVIPMEMIETDKIDTMATDGRSIMYSPKFVDTISKEEILGVLCHEVLHVANSHHLRRGKRDARLWNIACDYAINPIVIEAGMALPKGALLSDDFKGMTAEQIYNKLLEESGANAPKGRHIPEGDGWDMGGVSDKLRDDGQPLSKAEIDDEINETAVKVSQAAQAAMERGKLPASLKRLIDESLKPTVDWREELKRMFSATIPADYTWARGNRRHIASGLYLPSSLREGVGEIVVGIDTSGSIRGPLLDAFFAEVKAIFEDASPDRIHLVWCDAKVKKVQTFERGEDLTPEAVGGGGTDFRPVFDWVAEQGIEPQALIYLTDMEGVFPKEAPTYPVIWAKTTTHKAPFGDEIEVKV
jgi:predicted metal-dependent peptidase